MTRRDSGILGPFRSLLAAQALGTVQGLAFWIVIARLVDAHEVGVAAAAITTQTLVGLLVTLGLGTHLMTALPPLLPGRQHLLLRRALVVVLAVGLVVGGVLVVLVTPASRAGESLAEAVSGPGDMALMILGVVAAGWAVVVDEATLGLRRSSLQIWRNVVASSLRFPLVLVLVLTGHRDATALQAAWVLPLLVSVGVTMVAIGRAERHGTPSWASDVRGMLGPALRHQGLNLAVAASTLSVPVVAAVLLAPMDNAAFAIAWRVATVAFLPPYLVSVALFSHAASLGPDEFRAAMGRTLPAALLIGLALCAGAWGLGRPGLWIFGEQYVGESYAFLALMVPAGLWMVVKDHVVAWWRSRREFRLATALAVASVALEVGGAALGAVLAPPTGLAVGWLVGMAMSALLGLPWLRRVFRGVPWTWPRPALRRRRVEERGEVRPVTAAAVAVAVVLGLGAALLVGLSSLGDRDSTEAGGPAGARPSASAAREEDPGCDRSDGSPLLVDLGLQVATGDPDRPLLSRADALALARLAALAGADVLSTDVGWQDVLPSQDGPPRWQALDLFLEAAEAEGLRVRIELTGSPAWALDALPASSATRWRPPLSSGELRRWREFVALTMRHLDGRADYVEIWNEPDNDAFWTTGADPAAFARLVEATTPVIRRWAPRAQVITGGLAGNDIGFLEEFYDALTPGRSSFDLVGVHPFTGSRPPGSDDPSARFAGAFGDYDLTFTGYQRLHEVMLAKGDDEGRIYLGEFGYSTSSHQGTAGVSDRTRARYLTQALDLASCDPFVVALGWYYLHPTPWDPASWTLVDADRRPSRTYVSLATWTRNHR